MAEAPRVVKNDEIDPELVRLRRRVPIGPILALSVLGFAALMMWRLRADLAYGQEGDTPRDIGRATAPAALADNRFVALAGRVDAVAPVRVRGPQETGHRLAPFLGTGGKVWLHEPREAADAATSYDDRWTGRLRRLGETGFADELATYIASAPAVPRLVVDLTAVPTRDVNGDPLALTPETRVVVDEVVAGTARVLFVATDEIKDELAARAALAALGFGAAAPVESSDTSWSFDVAAPPAAVDAKLRAARRFGAAAAAKVVTHEGTVAELDLARPGVIGLGAAAIPRAAVRRAVFWVKPSLPADAWVLVAGDTPAGLWYMRPLYVLLAVIVLLMIWALVTDLRQLRRARPKPHLVAS